MHYYKGKAHDTYEKVTSSNHGPLYTNTYYKFNNATYYRLNNKGYLHAFRVTKLNFDGSILWYLNDYLLTDNDTLKDCGQASKYYKEKEELIAFIETLMKY